MSPSPDSDDRGEGPGASANIQNPYSAPRSDIALTLDGANRGAPTSRAKTAMGFGIVLCAGWPMLFGIMLSNNSGRYGILCATVLVAVPTLWICWSRRTVCSALGSGLLILGVLSIIPILPLFLGTRLIEFVTNGRLDQVTGGDTGIGHPLSFWQASAVTVLFSGCYIITAGSMGSLIQAVRKPAQ